MKMTYRKGGINIGMVVMLSLLGAGIVFGIVQYKKHERQKAAEEQRQLEEERARQEKAEAERKAEEERVRREKEEQEAKRRREREEREARIERERQERMQKEREAEEARRKEAEAESARERYRRARNAFGGGMTDFYSDAPEEKRINAMSSPYWYVDESFAGDKRIYEINGDSATVLFPNKLAEPFNGTSLVSSLGSKPGLLVGEGNVWICGSEKGERTCTIPERGSSFVPFDSELGDLVDVALELGVNPPGNRYHVAIRPKSGGKPIAVGVFNAADSVSRESIEKVVSEYLGRKVRRALDASAVKDYLAICKLVVRREKKGDKSEMKNDVGGKAQKSPQKCYRCHGKGTVETSVREVCDECGGTGVIVTKVRLKDTKHSTDGYWNYRHVGTKESVNKQTCRKCGRSGKVSVKKDVECPVCHGSGTR